MMRNKLILIIALFSILGCEKEQFNIEDLNGEIVFLSRRIPDNGWSLCKMDINGENQQQITEMTSTCSKPIASNSGEKILFVHYNTENEYELYLINRDGSNQILIDKSDRYCGSQSWSNDDLKIVYSKNRNSETDEKDIFLYNIMTQDIEQLTTTGNNYSPIFSTADNKVFYSSQLENNCGISVLDLSNRNSKMIIEKGSNPVLSPNGDMIAYLSIGQENSTQIFVADVEGQNKKQLTFSVSSRTWPGWPPDGNHSPVWTPDGSQIVYVSWEDEDPEIHIMNSNGNNKRKLTNTDKRDEEPTVTKDGKFIIFSSKRNINNQSEIFIMDINGRNQTNLSNFEFSDNFPVYITK